MKKTISLLASLAMIAAAFVVVRVFAGGSDSIHNVNKLILSPRYDHLLTFRHEGKESYFDFKDGKWQLHGELPIDETARVFFDEYIANLISECQK